MFSSLDPQPQYESGFAVTGSTIEFISTFKSDRATVKIYDNGGGRTLAGGGSPLKSDLNSAPNGACDRGRGKTIKMPENKVVSVAVAHLPFTRVHLQA